MWISTAGLLLPACWELKFTNPQHAKVEKCHFKTSAWICNSPELRLTEIKPKNLLLNCISKYPLTDRADLRILGICSTTFLIPKSSSLCSRSIFLKLGNQLRKTALDAWENKLRNLWLKSAWNCRILGSNKSWFSVLENGGIIARSSQRQAKQIENRVRGVEPVCKTLSLCFSWDKTQNYIVITGIYFVAFWASIGSFLFAQAASSIPHTIFRLLLIHRPKK